MVYEKIAGSSRAMLNGSIVGRKTSFFHCLFLRLARFAFAQCKKHCCTRIVLYLCVCVYHKITISIFEDNQPLMLNQSRGY